MESSNDEALAGQHPLGSNEWEQSNEPDSQLFRMHAAWLRTLAQVAIDSQLQGKFSASDIVQQTLMEAWKDWGNCRAQDSNQRKAWLRGILANQLGKMVRHYRGTQKRLVAREVAVAECLENSAVRLDQWSRDSGTPSHQAIANEQSLILTQTLERLPADYRQVLVMRHLEDLPHAEIARRMKRSEGAVRMLWVRALAQLRATLTNLE